MGDSTAQRRASGVGSLRGGRPALEWRDILRRGLITFSYDDGRIDNYTRALPLHEAAGIPASFAIIVERAEQARFRRGYMNVEQVREVAWRGVEINSHSVSHSQPLTLLSPAEQESELADSRRRLSVILGGRQAVETFCVPFSAYDDELIDRARTHYDWVRVRGERLNNQRMEQRVVFSVGLSSTTSLEDIRAWIDRAVRERKWLVFMLHGVVGGAQQPSGLEVHESLLKSALELVRDAGCQSLMPVQFADVLRARREYMSWCRTFSGRWAVGMATGRRWLQPLIRRRSPGR